MTLGILSWNGFFDWNPKLTPANVSFMGDTDPVPVSIDHYMALMHVTPNPIMPVLTAKVSDGTTALALIGRSTHRAPPNRILLP